MSLSFQTNVTALVAEENLRVNDTFQNQTITELTSGYRINSSGDDPAGLAVANGLRSQIAVLTEGVSNANDGTAVLQTIDGGLSNISSILNTLQTLATQSASSTFSGDRNTVNAEYQSLLAEINRQAANIGLNTGGAYNTNIGVYIGGGNNAQNSQVNVDLSGANNAVDTVGLGLANTSVAGGGFGLTGNNIDLNTPGAVFLTNGSQMFTFNIATPTGGSSSVNVTVNGSASGLTSDQVISQLNNALQAAGLNITASVGSNGQLQFSGSEAFTMQAAPAGTGGAIVSTGSTVPANTSNYYVNQAFAAIPANSGEQEVFSVQSGGKSVNVTLNGDAGTNTDATSIDAAIQSINTQLAAAGITGVTAVLGADTHSISLQGPATFSVNQTTTAGYNQVTSQAFTGITGDGSNTITVDGTLITLNKANAANAGQAAATIQADLGAPAASGITVTANGNNEIVFTAGNTVNNNQLVVDQTGQASIYTTAGNTFDPIAATHSETFHVVDASGGDVTVTLTGTAGSVDGNGSATDGTSVFAALASINQQLAFAGSGVTASLNNGQIVFSSASSFAIDQNADAHASEGLVDNNNANVTTIPVTGTPDGNLFAANGPQAATPGTDGHLFTTQGLQNVTAAAANSSGTANAEAALAALTTAVTNLGLVQGNVGSGETVLTDAINLAQSQITNKSASVSQIMDADIATEAANLTKSQVLAQSSVAALAQADAAPQVLLKLLQS